MADRSEMSGSYIERVRSRSPRRHRRKHRRHRRSHSRSHSPERSSNQKIYVNPSFGMSSQSPVVNQTLYHHQTTPSQQPQQSILGPTASQLLETNRYLENEVTRLRHEATISSQRVMTLENELRSCIHSKNSAEQRCHLLNSEKRRITDQMLDTKTSMSNIEKMANNMRNELNEERKKNQEKTKELEEKLHQAKVETEQIAFLTGRNTVLVRKCEELVTKNRQQLDEIDRSKQGAATARQEVDRIKMELDLRTTELARYEQENERFHDRERMYKVEKLEYERRLASKEQTMAAEKKKAAQTAQSDKDHIERLEARLRSEKPTFHNELATEAIFRAIEVVKGEFGMQMKHLFGTIDEVRDKQTIANSNRQAAIPTTEPTEPNALPEYLKTPGRLGRKSRLPQQVVVNEGIERPDRTSSAPAMDCPFTYLRYALGLNTEANKTLEATEDNITQPTPSTPFSELPTAIKSSSTPVLTGGAPPAGTLLTSFKPLKNEVNDTESNKQPEKEMISQSGSSQQNLMKKEPEQPVTVSEAPIQSSATTVKEEPKDDENDKTDTQQKLLKRKSEQLVTVKEEVVEPVEAQEVEQNVVEKKPRVEPDTSNVKTEITEEDEAENALLFGDDDSASVIIENFDDIENDLLN